MTLVASRSGDDELLLAGARHAFYSLLLSDRDTPPTTLEELVGPRPAWMTAAACRGMGPALWFPGQGGDLDTPRAVCERCPAVVECLAYALAHTELGGVWGGTSARERRRIPSSSTRAG